MHIWITGAHGFIGRRLARYLSARGYRVAGIGHGAWPDPEASQWGVSSWLNGEITAINLEQLHHGSAHPGSALPEVVFHLAGGSSVGAAIANPREDFGRTVSSTAELLEWIRQHSPGTRLVAISSAAVYGAGHDGPIAEDAPLSPFSPYGYHKLMMEELCRSYAANFAVRVALPRLFSVYGAGLKKQLLWDLCGRLAASEAVELAGTGDELRDWTHIDDVVRVLEGIAALASAQAPVINLATGTGTPVRKIAEIAAARWHGPGARVAFSGKSRPGDPFSLVANVTEMRAHGLACDRPVAAGIAEYVDWYRSRSGDD